MLAALVLRTSRRLCAKQGVMSTLAAGMAGTLPTALEEDLAACVGAIGQILLISTVLLFVVLLTKFYY